MQHQAKDFEVVITDAEAFVTDRLHEHEYRFDLLSSSPYMRLAGYTEGVDDYECKDCLPDAEDALLAELRKQGHVK